MWGVEYGSMEGGAVEYGSMEGGGVEYGSVEGGSVRGCGGVDCEVGV